MFLSHTPPLHSCRLLLHFSFDLLLTPPVSPPIPHFVHLPLVPFLLSYFISCLRHPEFFFICTSCSLPLLSSHLPILLHLILLHIRLPACLLPPLFNITFSLPSLHPFSSSYPYSVAPHLSGRPEPLHLPTTSAALPCQTVPISPEGWASAAHSTQASSGVPGTSRVPPTPVGPRPRHYHMATARPGGHTAPQAFSASSHPSLYAGE